MSSFLKSVLREDPLGSPFAPRKKPFLTLLSSFVNLAGQQDTNSQNAELQREQMEQDRITNETNWQINRQQFAKNMEWAREQFYNQRKFALEDRDYNDPSRVVERLQRAGVNPSSYFGQGQSATSSVSPTGGASASSSSSIGAGRSAPYSWSPVNFGDEINAINAYNQSELAKANAKESYSRAHNNDLHSEFLEKTLDTRIKEIRANAEKSGIEGDLARKQLQFIGATMDYDIKLRYGQTLEQDKALQQMDEQYRQMKLQTDILNITKSYSNELNRAQIAQIWHTVNQIDANIGLINSNKMLTDEQRNNEIQKVIGTKLDNGLKGVNYDVQKNIKDFLIQDSKNRSEILDFENRNKVSGERLRRLTSIIPFAPASEANFRKFW
jgi:hypothetical protein